MKQYIVTCLMKFFARLSLRNLQRLGACLGFLASIFPNENRRVARINIGICFPELSPKEQKKLLRQSLQEMAKTLIEMCAFWFWPMEKVFTHVVRIEGVDAIDAAFKEGRGLLVMGPHLGAWEVINFYLAHHYPAIVMFKPAKQAYLQPLIHQARQRTGSTLVPADNPGVKALYRALGDGKVAVLLPDQDPGSKGQAFAPFFGRPTSTMILANRLMQRNQPPAFFAYAERLPKAQGFVVHFIPATPLLGDEDAVVSTSAMNADIETCIRAVPSQYLWAYKRFKNTPPGMAPVY